MASQRTVVAVILGVLATAGGVGWWYTRTPPATAPAPAPVVTEPAPADPTPQFPVSAIEQAIQGTDTTLPSLFDSDNFVRDQLLALSGDSELLKLLVREHLIDRFVGFVDALPGKRIPVAMWPLKPAPGKFEVDIANEPTVIAASNPARYDRAISAFAALDKPSVVALYVRLYPLVQESYRGLGYGDKYFNDRLVTVIDHLLAAPEPADPIAVAVNDKGDYLYQDPQFETASAGHKFMLRIGAAHRATVKTELQELRALLAAQPIPEQAAEAVPPVED